MRTGRQQLVDALEDPRWPPGRTSRRPGLGAALAVPLVASERVLGVLSCYAGKAGAFDAATVAPIARFADQVALALVEAEQLERIELQTAALEATANAVIITDRNGRVEWVNRAFTDLTGYQPR